MENKFKDYFDKILIISLPYRTDRHREMVNELAKSHLEISPPHIEFFDAIRPEDKGKFPNIGARGCFLSHLKVLRLAQNNHVQKLLIMEDDLTIHKSWASNCEALIAELESLDWDIIYFGHELNVSITPEKNFTPYNLGIPLTHFYAVHSRIIPRLIDFLELVASRQPGDPLGGPMHVDGAITTFRKQNPDIKTFVATPSLGTQRASRTDIHALKWFDKTPAIKDLVRFIRVLKNQLKFRN